LLAPSENSASIEDHLVHLTIGGIHSNGLHQFSSRSIMTDEGSALVKVSSLISGYNHCLCSLHVHQVALRVVICFYVSTLYAVNILTSHLL